MVASNGLETFKAWLRGRVSADGRSVRAISRAAGINYVTLRHYLFDDDARPCERNALRLARFFVADPHMVREWLELPDLERPGPDPWGFSSLAEWLHAALRVRKETAGHAAAALGTPATTFHRWLNGGGITRPSIALLSIYFGVNRSALRTLRCKQAGKVAAGKARVERLGMEHMRALAATARAAAAVSRSSLSRA